MTEISDIAGQATGHQTRAEEIAGAIRDDILKERYRAGDRLPSERELAQQYHGSRGAVREAFKKLEQLGLATIHPGGARVEPLKNANVDVIAALIAVQEEPNIDLAEQVLDVIEGLYSIAVKQMVQRASDAEIAEARALLGNLSDQSLTPAHQIALHKEIGRFLMDSSHNIVLQLINNSLETQFVARRKDAVHHHMPQPDPEEVAEPMRQLDRALETRDAELAAAAISASSQINKRMILAMVSESSTSDTSAAGAAT